MTPRFVNHRPLSAPEIGFNATVVTGVSQNSAVIDVTGFNSLKLMLSLTRVAATDVRFFVQVSEDATTWHLIQSEATAAGVVTLDDRRYTKAVAANTQWVVEIDNLNFKYLRLFNLSATAGTTDTLTITGRLGYHI